MMEFLKINYDTFHDDVVKVVTKVLEDNKAINYVYGPARGGLLAAVLISHKFNLTYIHNENDIVNGTTLIIDDVNDTGKTFLELHEKYPDCVFASPYMKEHSNFKKDNYYYLKSFDNTWIVFPFEDSDKAEEDYEKFCERR